jgi:hypothetical protein
MKFYKNGTNPAEKQVLFEGIIRQENVMVPETKKGYADA